MIYFIFIFLTSLAQANQVKSISLKPNDVGVINTAVGYSTVIQVAQKPLNVVIGDQSSFRVEYIGNNITVKPLKSHSKTNLFIFTENDRFNLSLKSGGEALVDYVVQLRRIYEDPKEIKILNLSRKVGNITFLLAKFTNGHDGSFIDFSLSSSSKNRIDIIPEGFRVIQTGVPEPIKSLYLDKTVLAPTGSTNGTILFGKIDPKKSFALWLAIRGELPRKFIFSIVAKKKENTHEF